MSIERARNYLSTYGLDGEIMEFEMSSATVAEAALAINCQEAEIAKSLFVVVLYILAHKYLLPDVVGVKLYSI